MRFGIGTKLARAQVLFMKCGAVAGKKMQGWASFLSKRMFRSLGTAFFSVWYILFFKRNVPFFSVLFFESLATYETQKNVKFFSVLF